MLNIVDISVLVIVIASILFGLFSGFAQSLFSIIRILLSSMLAAKFSFIIINILEKYVFSELIKNYLGFIITFILSLIIITIIRHTILNNFFKSLPTSLDKILGISFGFLRGMLITNIIFTIWLLSIGVLDVKEHEDITFLMESKKEKPLVLQESITYNILLISSNLMIDFTPDWIIKKFVSKFGFINLENNQYD